LTWRDKSPAAAYPSAVASSELQQILENLPRVGTLVKDRGYRQVWRFEWDGRGYYLKFYPRGDYRDRWRRLFRGSPARLEFERLQALQRARIPSPKAIAYLAGFKPAGFAVKGDAVILEAIEPAVALDAYLNDLHVQAKTAPGHRDLVRQVIGLVYQLGKAKLGHDDLHLGNFLLHNGNVYLIDAYAVRPGGMKLNDVLQLGLSASRFATTTDLLRGWRKLEMEGPLPPASNPLSEDRWRTAMQKVFGDGDGRAFAAFQSGEWRGVAFKQHKYPRRWSAVSRMTFTDADWQAAWAELLGRIERDELDVLKRTRSGDVLAGDLVVGDTNLSVIVKRPRRKFWYRYATDVVRGGRARRAWFKSYQLIARNLPVAWPVLMMERVRFGYVTDALIVFECVDGPTLARADLDAIDPAARDMLFRRAGRTLRRMERLGLYHFDAKSQNWIVRPDDRLGPFPVMVDVDGVRRIRKPGVGIERLLRAMRNHPQYTPADSLALCRGFAPFACLTQEASAEETSDATPPLPCAQGKGD
jgi:tRNA A-37 threonylcarbamoyl transferase component Bud32